MKNYANDEWYVKQYGLETCKQMTAYEEDLEIREGILFEKMIEESGDLFRQINEQTGLNLNFKIEIEESRNGGKYIELESDEIRNYIIALAWKSFKIENFGGNIWHSRNKSGYYGNEEDFSKMCPEIGYGMSVDFSYNHIDGGSNGARIGHAQFTESKGKWEFTLERDRRN